MSKLKSKVVVITGGGRGIGLAIARACASEEAKVVLVGRHGAVLRQAARQISGGAMSIVADVTRPADVGRAFRRVREKFGRVDILVNNAGVFTYKPFVRTTLADWGRNIETNLTSIFLVTRAALPLLRKSKRPHLVNILSVASRDSFANCSAYTASKFGALGLTRVMALELRAHRIRVTAILPGATNTRLVDEFDFPIRRDEIIQPDDVAEAVLGAVLAPVRASVEEIVLTPSRGRL